MNWQIFFFYNVGTRDAHETAFSIQSVIPFLLVTSHLKTPPRALLQTAAVYQAHFIYRLNSLHFPRGSDFIAAS